MKKILLATILIGFGIAAHAADMAGGLMPGFSSAYTDMTGIQNPNSELRLLQQHRFRQEEYNEFQDMKQVKEARNRKIRLEQKMQNGGQQMRPVNTYSNDVNFVRENGKIILKRID